MSEQTEFNGSDCVVLPGNYLDTVEAVADLYSEQLAAAANNFRVDELSTGHRFFRGTLLALILWALSGIWTVCT